MNCAPRKNRPQKKKADSFVSLWNDSFTICDAIEQTYRPEDLSPSLVWFRLATMTFSAELYWLHFLFLAGNYSLIFPRLRFLWEMVYRAYYADTYRKESPKDPDGPGASLDEKSEWLEMLEEKCALGWGKMVKRVLCQVFPLAKQEREVLDYYHSSWKHLHKYVHPSHALLGKMIDRDGIPLNRFNKKWAEETLDVTSTVFDLIWLAVIGRFSGSARRVARSGLDVEYPVTKNILQRF